ncbi:MAG TPA: ABC transporter permease subunit [Pirellulales bacterium]|nr:ABC transporter permease subunit [Pirellulales bacterium]
MLIGPVFTRELITAPRRVRFYAAPAVYVAGLLVLTCTAWLLLLGMQQVRNVGDMARFGMALFQFLAPLQLVLAIFFSALVSASAVAQEKDRRTLELLLLTNLSNSELVLGKLLASLLSILMLLAASVPFFMFTALFGGVSFEQMGRVFVVTLVSALAAGSVGSMIALWREKTFQTLALTALLLAILAGWEVVAASGALHGQWLGAPVAQWTSGLSPGQALLAAAKPQIATGNSLPWFGSAYRLFLVVGVLFIIAVNLFAMMRVRVWNPSREARPQLEDGDEFRAATSDLPPTGQVVAAPSVAAPSVAVPSVAVPSVAARSVHAAAGTARRVWDNPVLWREVCTWAYGRKVIFVRLVYLALFAATAWGVQASVHASPAAAANLPLVLLPLLVLSLVLVNALAVTSITTERDLGALDLLLVTDITPSEFIWGKLGGVFYVAKEIVLLPLALCIYVWWTGALALEPLLYLLAGLVLMYVFVATLGVHSGLAYANSRSAVAVSLGTVFFLFIGVATCMRIMVSFSGSYELQLAPFLAFMIGGSAGLFVALGARNPSQAIGLASFLLPMLTFVAITAFLQGETLGVFLIVAFTYGLTTAAMLVPAISEFDIATGRTTE